MQRQKINLPCQRKQKRITSALKVTGLIIFCLYCFFGIQSINQFRAIGPFWDQLDFLGDSLTQKTINTQLFADVFLHQHGPHRMGIGGIANALILKFSDYNFRLLSQANLILIGTCGYACSLFSIKIFEKEKLNTFTIVTGFYTILALWLNLKPQAESIYLAANPAHSAIPILLFLGCLAVIYKSRNLNTIPDKLLFICLIATETVMPSTGFGIFFAISLLAYHILIYIIVKTEKLTLKYYQKNQSIISAAACILGLFVFAYNRDSNITASVCSGSPDINTLLQWNGAQILGIFTDSSKTLLLNIFISIFSILNLLFLALKCFQIGINDSSFKINSLLLVVQFSYICFALASCMGRGCSGIGAASASRYNLWPLIFLTSILIQYLPILFRSMPNSPNISCFGSTSLTLTFATATSIMITYSIYNTNNFLIKNDHYSKILVSLNTISECAMNAQHESRFESCLNDSQISHPIHPSNKRTLETYKNFYVANQL